jgi:hypothetical protein
MRSHSVTLGAINVKAEQPATLAAFWASVTGATPSAGGDTVYLPAAGPDGFAMFFQPIRSSTWTSRCRGAHADPRSSASSHSERRTSGTS